MKLICKVFGHKPIYKEGTDKPREFYCSVCGVKV